MRGATAAGRAATSREEEEKRREEEKSVSSPSFMAAAAAGVLVWVAAQCAFAQQRDEADFYVLPDDVPVNALDVRKSFDGLTPKEKQYAHWMAMASWTGSRICFEQVSAESPAIFELLQRVLSRNRVELRKAASRLGVSDQELEWFKQYAASFFSNMGNYSSFGDTKFIPRLAPQKLGAIVRAAAALDWDDQGRVLELFDEVGHKIYSIDPDERALGLEGTGTSAYYSENVTKAEIELVNAYMEERQISAYNTRLLKDDDGRLVLMAASVAAVEQIEDYRGKTIIRRSGDYADILDEVVKCFEKALLYAANDTQRLMIRDYIEHFSSGDVGEHKDAMRHWVRDIGPAVETNLGFIESYRDPLGVRGEWEGLVAIVNKEQTRKFGVLVDRAPAFLPLLPWGKDFEKDAFKKPDFTSLDVLCFANPGIPAGINIPNYDEIRQNEGFKNVSLGNVLAARKPTDEKLPFLEDADQDVFKRLSPASFEVQVGLHELLGHGSGKLLEERADGTFNFDKAAVKSPLSDAPVASWYKPGESWTSKFKELAGAFEECRAECVGLYLSTEPAVLKIFGHEGDEAGDVMYANWLNMARAGIVGLQYFDPKTQKWGQPHMHARFAILNVMLQDGDGLLTLREKDGEWLMHLDRAKIATSGKQAIGDFLRKLNVYKATADVAAARKLFGDMAKVDEAALRLREVVITKRKPRNIWVQPVTDVDNAGNVILREYPATYDGVIDSFLDRFGPYVTP
jgi:dipeptidyl-peptidase III